MRKIFFGAVLLFLSSCASYSLVTPFVDRETSNGGIIRSHFLMSSNSPQKLQIVANANCSRRGFGYAQIKQIQIGAILSGGGEFNEYEFVCKSGNQDDEKNEKKKIELTSMLDTAKTTCKELGFKEQTEKFSECALKLYSQSIELAAKNNQQVVMQSQSSGSNVTTIYDPVRDNKALMKQGQRMMSGACTLGVNC
jgi:hypothetical protein